MTLATAHPRWGFKKMFDKLISNGEVCNHKRAHRMYCELGLNIRIKPKKRLPSREAKIITQPIKPNVCWSMDFMSDALSNGRGIRTLNVIDDYNREALFIKASFSLPARLVIGYLEDIGNVQGYPEMIRVDNGPEFISTEFKSWAVKHQILIHYIQPGKPAQNALIERFNRTYREEVLDAYLFRDLNEVNEITEQWLCEYNYERPHQSLKSLFHINFAKSREDCITLK